MRRKPDVHLAAIAAAAAILWAIEAIRHGGDVLDLSFALISAYQAGRFS